MPLRIRYLKTKRYTTHLRCSAVFLSKPIYEVYHPEDYSLTLSIKILSVSKYQKLFYLILKTESLVFSECNVADEFGYIIPGNVSFFVGLGIAKYCLGRRFQIAVHECKAFEMFTTALKTGSEYSAVNQCFF